MCARYRKSLVIKNLSPLTEAFVATAVFARQSMGYPELRPPAAIAQ